MDRNYAVGDIPLHIIGVALRKESVDRNLLGRCRDSGFERVALRKESVDRNVVAVGVWVAVVMSLSARRAWIEIWPVAILLISVKSRSPQGERG